MNKDLFESLLAYKSIMAQAKILLRRGIITRKEYAHFDTMFTKKYGLSLDSMKYISSALSAIKPMVLMNVQDFDKDGFLLNTPGQTYDLRSGGKRGYAPQASDYITKQTLVSPDTDGKELWDKALDTFFCGDRQLIIDVVQRANQ
ncbi:MAG: hypothetical protein IJT44_06720 [Clostridia bacterium]|nr:hypothetical protein [Clostridia bacterium]